MKKVIFLSIIIFISSPILAFSSSSFLISQLAFKNYDYSTSLKKFNYKESQFYNENLLDKIIAAVIIEDLSTANKLANDIITKDENNQEAYIVKLVYLYLNDKFEEIEKLYNDNKNKMN